MTNPTKEELQQAVEEQLGNNLVLTIGYLEHQIDLQGKLIEILISKLEGLNVTFTTDEQTLITNHQGVMAHSSVDFNNLTSPLESYKIPGATAQKQYMRQVQGQYLKRLQQLGLL